MSMLFQGIRLSLGSNSRDWKWSSRNRTFYSGKPPLSGWKVSQLLLSDFLPLVWQRIRFGIKSIKTVKFRFANRKFIGAKYHGGVPTLSLWIYQMVDLMMMVVVPILFRWLRKIAVKIINNSGTRRHCKVFPKKQKTQSFFISTLHDRRNGWAQDMSIINNEHPHLNVMQFGAIQNSSSTRAKS